MRDEDLHPDRGTDADLRGVDREDATAPPARKPPTRIFPLLITLCTLAIAVALGWPTWNTYMETPWTRDATVRSNVVTMAPEVAGRIVDLRAVDNRYVRKGEVLMVIDPTDYGIALRLAEANVELTSAKAENTRRQAQRRNTTPAGAYAVEEQQSFSTDAAVADAQNRQALASRDQAKANLDRTQMRSPVNGWITNLLVRQGNYATVGQNVISIVDANSFWVDAYFEETKLESIREGDPATVKLMGYTEPVQGQVAGVARGINIPNAQPGQQGLATVNPIFTWVRLAQRVPVRIRITQVPDGVRLVAGMTATVYVGPRSKQAL